MNDPWTPPPSFAEYTLHRSLGRGQMGEVFVGYDALLDRHVAIKLIRAQIPSEALRRRFLIEARAAARVQHPNVVAVYRVGELENRAFLVSELVEGKSLDKLETPIAWHEVLKIGIGLSRGLAAAHRKGVLHRDIKPANAIVALDGEAKLLDFGLAKLLDIPALTSDLPVPKINGEISRAETLPPELEEKKREITNAAATMLPDQEERAATRAGTALGTPDYMAPEAWRGELLTRASDVYSLGCLLYELCSGRAPFVDVAPAQLAAVTQIRDPLPLSRVAPDVDPRFAQVIERCLRREPNQRFASAEELRDALEALGRKNQGSSIPEGNPYRGLRPFEAAHRALFFGRDADIRNIVDRLRSDVLVLVAGDSGIGKSSLCRAGVLPAIIEEGLEPGRRFSYVTLTPGPHPARSLSAALAGMASSTEEEVEQLLAEDPAEITARLRRRLGSTEGLVIYIDQLEELIAQASSEEVTSVERFLLNIAGGAPGIRVLATARADFLTRLVSLPVIGDVFSRAIHILQPLSKTRIRQVIVGPAELAHVEFESESLVESLVESASGASGGLPLLQFALTELFEARDLKTQRITERALEEIGGVSGALERHADGVIQTLRAQERDLAKKIFVRLVTRGEARVRRTEAELAGDDRSKRAVLDALVRGRLLVVEDGGDRPAYQLAHEVLIRGWRSLRAWIEEDAGACEVRDRLEVAAAEWSRLGAGKEGLWSRRQQEEAKRLDQSELGASEVAFLRASNAAAKRSSRLKLMVLASVTLAILLPYAGARLKAELESSRRVRASISNAHRDLSAARAEARSSAQLRGVAFEAFDRQQRSDGEKLWARALEKTTRARGAYRAATRTLESALAIDHDRTELSSLFGEILFERALEAERERWDELDELALRFRLYDPTHALADRWDQQASIDLSALPSTSRITAPIHAAAGRGLELAPGFHILVIEGSEHPPTNYPILLARGEKRAIVFDVHAAGRAPPGFAFIPAGRFIFGSTADEESRLGFFDAVPAHSLELDSFVIAKHEVTFADWILYLNALPPEERAARTPVVTGDELTGTMRLSERSARAWWLSIQPGDQRYEAAEGTPIQYRSRDRRAVQDWLRLPVTGISAEDVEAYARWLSNTRRLPGARLCTEREWEKAARGADGREFPHGTALAPDDANFDRTYAKDPGGMGPDEVGSHPLSRSPYGVEDMAGNAFEWTVAEAEAETYVLKGGSYFYDSKTNQLSNRQVAVRTLRMASVGARLCAGVEEEIAKR